MIGTDVIQQVADKVCGNYLCSAGLVETKDKWQTDSMCQGTGLRWSTLSRECVGDGRGCYQKGCFCNGSGRVADVTLEKVLELLCEEAEIGDTYSRVMFAKRPHGWSCWEDAGKDCRADTPLEAACAALLASI